MNRRGLLVSLALLVGAAMFAPTVSASAGKAQTHRSALQLAVRRGALDQRVLSALDRNSSVDALVTFDDSRVLMLPVPVSSGQAAGSGASSEAIVQRMYRVYGHEKRVALRGLSGVHVLQDYSVLPTSYVRIDSRSALQSLLDDPLVVGVGANLETRTDLAESLPLIHQPDAAAAGYTGAGTAVAVMDTGVDYTRSAFGSCSAPGGSCKVAYAQDFTPTDDGQLDADPGMHGTNVAGIVVGVAPGTKILALDVFNGASASFSDITNAINFVISSRSTYNTRAMNLSLGARSYNNTECTSSALASPFANARAAGIMPVVAAGNDAYLSDGFHLGVANPACAPGAMRVGAVYDSNVGGPLTWGRSPDLCTDNTTAADQITCFSQTGPLLTVLAPGAIITAAGVTESGTSQATPHVSGAVAVLAAKNPSATLDSITAAIANSGPLITDTRSGANNQQNHRFDLLAAANAIGGGTNPTLTVTKAGTGTGTVTSSPAGINCGSTCSATFTKNTTVTLTAAAASGSTFGGWSGAGCSGTGTCVVTMDVSKSVTATFNGSVGGQFRPDALIDGRGDDLYNATGTGQTHAVRTKLGHTAVFQLVIENDSTKPDDIYFQGTGGSRNFTVNYLYLGQNVTVCVLKSCHFENPDGSPDPFDPGQTAVIVLRVKVNKFAKVGSSKTVSFGVISGSDPSQNPPFDIVKAKVTAKI